MKKLSTGKNCRTNGMTTNPCMHIGVTGYELEGNLQNEIWSHLFSLDRFDEILRLVNL